MTAPKRVLIVDDDPDILVLYRNELSKKGFDVDVAANSAECREKIRATPPTLIILDIVLGPDHGAILYDRLIEEGMRPETPVIFLTAFAEDHDVSKAKPGRRYALLNKRMPIREVIHQIECLTESHPFE